MDLATQDGRQELGTRIQSAIMGAGFASLPEFARQMGWSRALIYQYVSGSVLVQLDRLERIAEATGRPLEWFVAARPGADAERTAELTGRLRETEARLSDLHQEVAQERAARLAGEARGRAAETTLLADLCRALRRLGDAPGLVEAAARWGELAAQAGDAPAQMAAHLQMGHGWAIQGQLARAAGVLAQAVQEALAQSNEAATYSARQELARVLLQSGSTDAAQREAEALAAAPLWWPRWSGHLLLAAIAIQSGHLQEAAEQLLVAQGALDDPAEPAARRGTARAYLVSNQVNLALAAGDYHAAARHTETLRAQAAQTGTADQLREAELNRAVVALRRGEVEAARAALDRLDEWATQAADARIAALAVVLRSELSRRCGDGALARSTARRALELATELRHPQIVAEAELALAHASEAQSDADGVSYHAARCAKLAADTGWARLGLEARLLEVAAGAGDPSLAAAELPALLARARDYGAAHLEADVQLRLAGSLPLGEAIQTLEQVALRAAELGYFWGAHAALVGLARAKQVGEDHQCAAGALERAVALRGEEPGRADCPALIAAEASARACLSGAGSSATANARRRSTRPGATS